MGLSICAIRDMMPTDMTEAEWDSAHPNEDRSLDDGIFCLTTSFHDWQEETFPGRLGGLEIGVIYRFDPALDKTDMSMGAYTFYNRFREMLSEFDSQLPEGPLFEDITSFSDCDGYIGPETASELHCALTGYRDDFQDFIEEAWELESGALANYMSDYDGLVEATYYAKDDGVMVFC